uniref:CDC42 effector protein 4 n=1 Tax=Crocodylus porosus TaxID=8502 RepID=A0A7M4FNK0_CROPO
MPILKQLVSNSAHSKRRSRADLTAEMISAPLGDFRHTMHVGRAGDAFGDTSFLNSKAGEPEPPEEPGGSKPAARPQSPGLDDTGMKHAESILSFHIDLGPSMLGDVLSIMDKDPWEQEEDSGAEEPPWGTGSPQALRPGWLQGCKQPSCSKRIPASQASWA